MKLKKKLDYYLNFILTKRFIVGAILIIILIVFHNPIERIFTDFAVNNILHQVESIWYNDVIFFMIGIYILLFTIFRFGHYTPSFNSFLFFSLTTTIYCYYRFVESIWIFTPLKSMPFFKYADLLVLVFVCHALLLIKKVKLKTNDILNSFHDDEPLDKNGKDELGYKTYALQLSEKILASRFEKSFAIGINGKWGLGKTSFINLIKRSLLEHDLIEINFNPWISSNPKSIVQEFFNTFQKEISSHHSLLSGLLLQYSNKLIGLNDNTLSRSIQATLVLTTGFDSIDSLYNQINVALKKIDKKIIVYIDDLDRLDKEEIIEVLRLIRNTANFYNTFFIVAYDKNYLNSALRDYNSYNHEKYLEKIFQIEITLPLYYKDKLRQKLFENLKVHFPEQYHSMIEKEIVGTYSRIPGYLDIWLETMRDVTRVTNSLILNINKLIGEVEFSDFLKLEILRIKYPSVYELLFIKTNEFLVSKASNGSDFTYELINIEGNTGQGIGSIKNESLVLFQFINANKQNLSVPENEINKIIELIRGVFPSGIIFGPTRSHLSAIYPSKFDRYFAYNLLKGNLSEIDFSKGRLLSQEEFNSLISVWIENGLEYELKERFSRIDSFDNKQDFEKVLKAIFFLANLSKKKKPNQPTNELVGYDGQDLLKKINNYNSNIEKKFYSGEGEKEKYEDFIKSLFTNSSSPHIFESKIASLIVNAFSDEFGLPKDEFEKILLNYLVSYYTESKVLNRITWELFHNCRRTIHRDVGFGSFTNESLIIPEAKDYMHLIISENIDIFLFDIIRPEIFDKRTFAINEFVLEIYGSWAAFKDLLTKIDEANSKYLKEFKLFLEQFEKQNYAHYVSFDFKEIPINSKIGDSD